MLDAKVKVPQDFYSLTYHSQKLSRTTPNTTAIIPQPSILLSLAAPVCSTPPLILAGELEAVELGASTTETIVDVTGPLLPPVITATLVTVSCCGAPPVEVAGTESLDVLVAAIVPLLLEEEDVMLTLITVVPFRFGTSLVLPLVRSVVVALSVPVTLAASPVPSPADVSVELHIMEPTDTVFVDRRAGASLVKGRPPIPVRLSNLYGKQVRELNWTSPLLPMR